MDAESYAMKLNKLLNEMLDLGTEKGKLDSFCCYGHSYGKPGLYGDHDDDCPLVEIDKLMRSEGHRGDNEELPF